MPHRATPLQVWFESGIPELDVPPRSWVFWWPFQRRFAVYTPRDEYDHGVILNHIEQGLGVLTTLPGPGVVEAIRAAVGQPHHLAEESPQPAPSNSVPPRHLRLLD